MPPRRATSRAFPGPLVLTVPRVRGPFLTGGV